MGNKKAVQAGAATPGGDVFARPNISHNQTMIVAGLMKRLISQIPVALPGQRGRSRDFGTQVTNLLLLLKKRTSLRPVF